MAWIFNFLVPAFLAMVIALIVHPPTRRTLFPPVPLALISTTGGEKQTPPAGYLGSKDSLTGAAEAYKGQAVEQEASNFVTGLTNVAVGSAVGQGAPSASASVADDEDEKTDVVDGSAVGEVGSSLPDPTSVVSGAANAQAATFGETAAHDKTKKHVENAIWEQAGPVMHAIATIADTWERFAKSVLSRSISLCLGTHQLYLQRVVPNTPVRSKHSSASSRWSYPAHLPRLPPPKLYNRL